MAVVYGIVKDYGGAIKVESALGKGTTIHIFFPTVEEGFKKETTKPILDSKNTHTILLVDDEELIVEVAHAMLEKLGYEVSSTTNSIEALEIFKSAPDRFGLVITDAAMPKMKGKELIQNILSIRPHTPVIMCTGSSGIITEQEARETGASAFLRKPFKKADMIMAIQEALAA